MVISPDSVPTNCPLLEQEASHDLKGSRTTPTEESQQAQDVVLGMFLASSHPATVLFDSGASHSFISSSFVVKHQLPITIMKQTVLVSSPGGEMRTKHICPVISITIRGVDFLANLIVLDS
jgi:hypothetical protein